MTPTPERTDGEFSLPDFLQQVREFGLVVWKERREIYRAVAIAIPIGLLIAFGKGEEFAASTKILPYRNAANTGGLSSLAGLAGIRLPSGASDQTITADLYPVITRTLDFRISVAESPLRFRSTGKSETMVHYFTEHRSVAERLAGQVDDARTAVTSLILGKPATDVPIAGDSSTAPLHKYTKQYLKIVDRLDEQLVVSMDKKTFVISITGTMPDPYAAADLVQVSSQRLMQRIIEYEAKKAGEQLNFLEEQYQKNRRRYEDAQKNLALFSDRNRILVGAVAQIERERLQRENDVAYQVLQQFSLELEQARVKKNQDTPVFTVLEQVVVPNTRSSPARTMILIVCVMLGVAVGLARIAWRAFGPSDSPRSATT